MDFINKAGLFALLLVAQVMMLNHIRFFGVATPMLCIYFVIRFQRNYPRWAMLLWAFFLGLLVDIFSDTPGISSASLTLAALLQPYLLNLFVQRDAAEEMTPTLHALGPVKFSYYAMILVLVYCMAFFTLEAFSFLEGGRWLSCVGGSSVLTFIIVYAIENLRQS